MQIISLALEIPSIYFRAIGEDITKIFVERPECRGIAVHDDNEAIIGIIERAKFLSQFSTPFGREIYGKRTLDKFIKRDFICFDENDTIDTAADIISKNQEASCAIVIVDKKYHGIIDITEIYKSLASLWTKRAHDLEVSKRLAEAARDAKARFLATMSHEIRTPLNGVIGMAQAIRNKCHDEFTIDAANTILDSGNVLMRVVDDILDMSKIENGKLEFNHTPTDVYALIKGSMDLFTQSAAKKSIELNCEISAIEGYYFEIDNARLRQIILNILSNAIKFTQDGFVKLRANLCSSRDNQRILTIEIEDTGIGMSSQFRSRLFQAFEQEDNCNSRGFGGTGLGLSISHRIACLMGGDIKVTSEQGKGSTFSIILPVNCISSAEIEHNGQNFENDSNIIHDGTIKILVAEDNPTNRLVLKTLLESFDFDITFAFNGEEAVEARKNKYFDLVFMDLQMPKLDGLNATKLIREYEKQNKLQPIPIYALSANAMEHHVRETEKYGFDGHIAKPIILEKLLEKIEHALENQQIANHQMVA